MNLEDAFHITAAIVALAAASAGLPPANVRIDLAHTAPALVAPAAADPVAAAAGPFTGGLTASAEPARG